LFFYTEEKFAAVDVQYVGGGMATGFGLSLKAAFLTKNVVRKTCLIYLSIIFARARARVNGSGGISGFLT